MATADQWTLHLGLCIGSAILIAAISLIDDIEGKTTRFKLTIPIIAARYDASHASFLVHGVLTRLWGHVDGEYS